MRTQERAGGLLRETAASGRIALATLAICCLAYGSSVWAVAQALVPSRAGGSLVRNGRGEIVGSRLIAQGFSRPEYLWPRPSACDYNASAAGGSNLSPASPELRAVVRRAVERYGADGGRRLPADLAAASGSGLDPHITREAAWYQADRIAAARKIEAGTVRRVIDLCSERAGGVFAPGWIVNVLQVNMELDRLDLNHE